MTNNSLQSRINPFSIIAGILFTLALMFVLMSLAAALGIWSYRTEELTFLGPRIWTIASAAWALSVFCGCFLTVLASKPEDLRSSVLNSLTTWAGSFILFGGLSQSIAESAFQPLQPTKELFRTGFLGDAGSLITAVLGGALALVMEKGFATARAKSSENSKTITLDPNDQHHEIQLNIALESAQKGHV